MEFLVAATERRSVRRFVRLECEVVRERGFKLLGKKALDLSTSGMRFAALDDALSGDPVVLTFRAPGSKIWIDAEGVVSRVAHGRRTMDFGMSMAVQFTTLPDDLKTILRKHLLKCPPTVPKRGSRIDYAASIRKIAGM